MYYSHHRDFSNEPAKTKTKTKTPQLSADNKRKTCSGRLLTPGGGNVRSVAVTSLTWRLRSAGIVGSLPLLEKWEVFIVQGATRGDSMESQRPTKV